MLCLPKYFDGNGRGFMMASIKDDLTAFESIKEKTRPRYKKTWVEFKDFIGAGEEFDSRSPTEEELSSYLRHLRQEKGAASSSMGMLYSMINGVFKEKCKFKGAVKFFSSAVIFLNSTSAVKKNNSTAKMNEYE